MRRLAYHFTHLDNLDSILEAGRLICDNEVQELGLLSCETADSELKLKRRTFPMPVSTGGVLGDFVPFYFAPRSPMLLKLATGRVANYSGGQDPLVFWVIDIDQVMASGRTCLATDGHPVARLSRFLEDRQSIEDGVDWEVMALDFWNDTDADGDRERRRQAEFLVHSSLDLRLTLGVGVRNQAVVDAVNDKFLAAGRDLPVHVRPKFYYEGKP
jgi:ssDNA thymidine ADP-ribosyltransferase, DarT